PGWPLVLVCLTSCQPVAYDQTHPCTSPLAGVALLRRSPGIRDEHGTALAQYAHPTLDGRSRHALLPRATALLLHDHMNVEDVPVWITHVEGAMARRLGCQLLDPLDLETFETGVLPLHIRDFQLNQDTIIDCTSQSTQPVLRTLGLAPQGEGTSLQSK